MGPVADLRWIASPPGSKLFHFHAVFDKIIGSHFGSWRPLSNILDPPLASYSHIFAPFGANSKIGAKFIGQPTLSQFLIS